MFTLEKAIDKGLIEPEENHSFLQIFEYILSNKLQAKTNEGMSEKDEETRLKQDSDGLTSPPNILFNVRPAKSRLRLYFTAVAGVLLQFGVLVFSGFITYYPTLAFPKGDSPVIGYAYPLTASGTLLLVLGMLICSFVVEQFTNEETWKTKGGRKFDLMWLQQGQEVNDQMFDSYAIFALESRDSILTSRSRRHPEPLSIPRGTIKYRVAEILCRICRPLLQFFNKGNHNPAVSLAIFKILVISGTLISICGFVVQFIGLREMHWSATIAQLSATLIMVVLRAWVRWDLASRPHSQRVAQGHELDWLATRIAREQKGPRVDKGLWAKPDSNDPFWTNECWRWEIITGGDVEGYEIRNPQDDSTENVEGLTNEWKGLTVDGKDLAADEVVKVRQRLGLLSHWPSKASQPAISVAIAVEAVMNNLFTGTNDNGPGSLTWSMDGLVDGKSQKIFFKLRRNNNRWTADATEIEAALSLWLYSVGDSERTEAEGRKDSKDSFQKPQENGMRDWLRLGNAALRKENIRLLGMNKPASGRDLTWYLGEKVSSISIVQENGSNENSTSDMIIIESRRVVGFRGKPATRSFNAKTVFKRRDPVLYDVGIEQDTNPSTNEEIEEETNRSTFEIEEDTNPFTNEEIEEETNPPSAKEYLAMVSDTPLEMLLAQEMFSAFMWGVAKRVSRIEGDSKVHRNDNKIAGSAEGWRNIRLENSKLLRAAEAFQKAGLGSVEDAYSTIIPPLSLQGKLPVALTVVEYARGIAQEAEAARHWELAGEIYLWLFEVGKTFATSNLFVVTATAILTEFSSLVDCMLEDLKAQQRSEETLDMLINLYVRLSEALETADNSIRDVLRLMYVIQHRDERGKHKNPGPDGQEIITALDVLAGPRFFRSNGPPPSYYTDILGWTALHYAAIASDWDTAQTFFETRASKTINPNLRTLAGWTALHLAAYKDPCTVGWRLADQRCDLEIQGRDGMRPLHVAVREGSKEMVRWLLDAGANIDARDSAGRTPLHWAAHSVNSELVALLKEKGANHVSRDENGRIPLHLAAIARYTASLEDLADDDTIEAHDRMQSTPLLLGAMMGAEDFVKNLLQLKVNVNTRHRDGQTPLSWAARKGHEYVVKLLIGQGANVNSNDIFDRTPIIGAAANGHETVVEVLIEKGADVDPKDKYKQTPLSFAARSGHETVVEVLIEKGADVDSRDWVGQKPLSWAARRWHETVVELLIEKGANVDSKNEFGQTPLSYAAEEGQMIIVELLIKKGAQR
ncbi:hypothetical protein EPUS_04743 [Endocarpon pusillum Z07020]|uniref:Uncharacterized protein n=1 Tax=Endocarpon pusillum (strain Z07020 / HMAS-L-300199) TaxID=1263415 RepID=U1HJN8_ENDPU|nr:uncharacterized protein EPUS_04743 [Endocarpon pusillum Z07020]ERF70465.1 hypothetical protein EPUS_04743 [Endocarpon pusillum Z07020]